MQNRAGIKELLDYEPAPGNLVAPAEPPEPETAPHRLRLLVSWGDLTQVSADVHLTGHYQGVMPVAAELALDRAISQRLGRSIIAEHTRRGWLDGRLGEVSYFPSASGVVRLAAVAGLGRHGTFNQRRGTLLYSSLLSELALVPQVQRAASVLVGSGAGNLRIAEAIAALVDGFTAALPRLVDPVPALQEVVLVEIDHLRAQQMLLALQQALSDRGDVGLDLADEVRTDPGGTVSDAAAAVYSIMALATLSTPPGDGSVAPQDDARVGSPAGALAAVLDGVEGGIRPLVEGRLKELAGLPVREVDRRIRSADGFGSAFDREDKTNSEKPVRISVLSGPDSLRWAALSDQASVPERQVPRMQVFDELVDRLNEPTERDLERLPEWLTRMVIPTEFQQVISDRAPLILELDRRTAPLHWEFLSDLGGGAGDGEPLVVRIPIARQLRTGYARVPIEPLAGQTFRALVVGDPGAGPDALPGARIEALRVASRLRELGLEVAAYIGPPSQAREEELADIPPATHLEVLGELLSGRYDLVHFCGHGTVNVQDTDQPPGWVFADGLITARELSQLVEAPRMVIANACYTSVLSEADAVAPLGASPQAQLTPGLADEFLRAGAVHYVGAAWRTHDAAGVTFAETFYAKLFGQGTTIGGAMCAARRAVHARQQTWGATWAAYQHYGDPTDGLPTGSRRITG
jgi:hypothetical protein